jgi:hypothetical protein
MIAWKNETEALGYATSRMDDAVGHLSDATAFRDGLALAQGAINDATAALVMVQHMRKGDALVTIDQLVADHADTGAAQPRRRCCQTYIGEAHARQCSTWGGM